MGVDDALPPLLGVILLFGVLTVGVFWLAGAYQRSVHVSFAGEVRDVFRAVALTGAVTLGLLYLLRLQEVSRLMLVYLFIAHGAGCNGGEVGGLPRSPPEREGG